MYSKAGFYSFGGVSAAPKILFPSLSFVRCERGSLYVSPTRSSSSSCYCRRGAAGQSQCGMVHMPLHSRRNAADDDHLLKVPAVSFSRTSRKGRAASLQCKAALEFEVTPASVALLTTVLSFVALRTYIYFRMEYIIAAMLGRHVPRGGAKVVELNVRGGKNLYYYPSDTVQVLAVSSKPNVQLLENQAVRAGVPIQIKTNGPMSLGVPSGTMDAVVSVFSLKDISAKDVPGVLQEVVRVLKPGKPLIFVEWSEPKSWLAQGIRSLSRLGGSKSFVPANDLLSFVQAVDGFEGADYERFFTFVDPHIVGIARKKLSVVSEPGKEPRKGFKQSKKS